MNKMIMFPVLVLIMCTLVSAPSFWGADEDYIITRTVTETQLADITDAVNDYQDIYGYDQPLWSGTATDYYEAVQTWLLTGKEVVITGMAETLNDTFNVVANPTLENIHELMSAEIADLIWMSGDPDGYGDYITELEVQELINIEPYMETSITYEQNLTFSREIDTDIMENVYSGIVAYQYEYGDDSWFDWNVKNHSVTVYEGIYDLLILNFGETEELISIPYADMSRKLTDMIHDAGEVESEADLLDRETVYNIIKIDPDMYDEMSYLNDRGIALDSNYIWVGVLLGIIALALVTGLKVFGSGISDTSVNFVVLLSVYYLIWGILSIGSASMIKDTAIIGVPIWVMLTLVYTMGVIGNISGGE